MPYYVFGGLFSEIGQLLLKREITGGAQGGITKPACGKGTNSIPPKDVDKNTSFTVKSFSSPS